MPTCHRPKIMLMLLYGPTGVGKSTVINILVERYQFSCVTTFTTRPPRDDDRYKISLSEEEFSRYLRSNMIFCEKPPIGGFRYGEHAVELEASTCPDSKWCLDMSIKALNVVLLPENTRQLESQLERGNRPDRILRARQELIDIENHLSSSRWPDGEWRVLVNNIGMAEDVANTCEHLSRMASYFPN
jgi:guanylate kinase